MIRGPIGKGIGRKHKRCCNLPWPQHTRDCEKAPQARWERRERSYKAKARESATRAHKRRYPRCERPDLPAPCWGPPQVHHIMPASMGGTTGEQGPLVTLCAGHHNWVENNRAEAKRLGLLMRREAADKQ